MITKINKISCAIAILLLAMAFTACSPDDFKGADPNGIPTVSGIDFNITVDQETNQMIATYTPQPGTYPIWILDGTSYSTLQEVGYKNSEAGTHTIELRLGNRNGISQTGIKKEYTFNESKIDYSNDFRRIANKEWRIDHKEVAHMACGPAGTAGTGWWSAQPDEKKDFGVYDDRLIFSADNLKGGSFTYNSGEDGFTYVNKGTTKWGAPAPEDWDAVIVEGEQVSSWSFEVYDWEDADGNVSKQTYIQFAPNTAFPYISSDEQYENPRFRIESLTAKKMVLIYEPKDRSIAWRFIFTSAPEEKGFFGFDANSDFNMWKNVDYNMFFWYAPGWSQIADPGFSYANGVYTITANDATVQEWQAQCAINGVPLHIEKGQAYDVRVTINTNMDLPRATVKVNKDPDVTNDPNTLCYKGDFALEDGENVLQFIGVVAKNNGEDIEFDQGKFILDFGGCPDGFEAKVSNIIIQKHK